MKAEDLEVVHRKFCKLALGVPNTATNLAGMVSWAESPWKSREEVQS